jgi:SAM-dependent methyltransferase
MSGQEHPILRREREWEDLSQALLGGDAALVYVSRWLPDSRTYATDDRVAVIRIAGTTGEKPGNFGAAIDALRALGREFEHRSGDAWEALVMPRFPGQPLELSLPHLSAVERLRVLGRAARAARGFHRAGVAHRDLRPENVLLAPDGSIELVDFDRAVTCSPRAAALSDWLGVGPAGLSENPYWSLVLFTLVPRGRSLARRVRALARRPRGYLHAWARPDSSVPDDVRQVARAWALAQDAGANAPGQGLAYYAMTYRGHHLPGERPWDLRWEAIRRSVGFEGKAVLELGCNLGLLSSYALLHGARSAVAVDHNAEILECAALVADALGVAVDLREVDLGASEDWESPLRGADLVTALSVAHWLPDPNRLLRFLGEHREVLYEGHDPLEAETGRLRSVGFQRIDVLLESERGRHVLHGRR